MAIHVSLIKIFFLNRKRGYKNTSLQRKSLVYFIFTLFTVAKLSHWKPKKQNNVIKQNRRMVIIVEQK